MSKLSQPIRAPSVPVREAVFLVFNVENNCRELSSLSDIPCASLVLFAPLSLLFPKNHSEKLFQSLPPPWLPVSRKCCRHWTCARSSGCSRKCGKPVKYAPADGQTHPDGICPLRTPIDKPIDKCQGSWRGRKAGFSRESPSPGRGIDNSPIAN